MQWSRSWSVVCGQEQKVVEIEEGANDTHWQNQVSLSDGFSLIYKKQLH